MRTRERNRGILLCNSSFSSLWLRKCSKRRRRRVVKLEEVLVFWEERWRGSRRFWVKRSGKKIQGHGIVCESCSKCRFSKVLLPIVFWLWGCRSVGFGFRKGSSENILYPPHFFFFFFYLAQKELLHTFISLRLVEGVIVWNQANGSCSCVKYLYFFFFFWEEKALIFTFSLFGS